MQCHHLISASSSLTEATLLFSQELLPINKLLQAHLYNLGIPDRHQSELVLRNVAKKKNIMSCPKLLEESCQDPAPSKDFCHMMVTEKGVIWRRWKVSVRNITQGAVPAPVERGFTVEEFLADKDMQGEVGRVMGSETLQRALRLLRGQNDLLSRLSEKVLF